MANYQKFQQFAEDIYEGVHDLGADNLKVMLTNVAPNATDSVLADITEIAAGNGYTAGGEAVTVTGSSQAGGTYSLVCDDVTFTASGGNMAQFRYVVLYNDTPTSPLKPLIGFWDNGSAVDLTDGESLTVDFNDAALLTHS